MRERREKSERVCLCERKKEREAERRRERVNASYV